MYHYERQLIEDRLRYLEHQREDRRRFLIVAVIFAICGIGFMMGTLALATFTVFLYSGQPFPQLVAIAPPAQAVNPSATATPLPTPTPELVAAIPLAPPATATPVSAPVQPMTDAPFAPPAEPTMPAPVEIIDAPPTESTAPPPVEQTQPAIDQAPPVVAPQATLPPVVEPTATPAPPPTATPSLPAAVSGINSGGLGLTRAEWEARHGAPSEDDGAALVRYGALETGAWDVTFTENRVMYIRFDNEQGQDPEFLEATGVALLPADAQFVNSYSPALTPDMTVRVYKSQALAEQLGADCYCWFGGEPGTMILMYTLVTDPNSGERVSNSVAVGTGNSP